MNAEIAMERFVQLRSEGLSFARIAQELNVSKPTLIKWSRKFQYQIQNLRAIHLEELQEKWLASRSARLEALGQKLQLVEAELAKRDLSTVPTPRLFHVADSLRRQIQREIGRMEFSSPTFDFPQDEYHEQALDWRP